MVNHIAIGLFIILVITILLRTISKNITKVKDWLPNLISIIGFLLMAIWWMYAYNR
jgi:hypothetical protein